MENNKFDYIRSYRDNEVRPAFDKLMEDKEFHYILNKIYPGISIDDIKLTLEGINTVQDFQFRHIAAYNNLLVEKTINNFSYSGFENLKPDESYIFVSNHRDIVLDSALLNQIMFLEEYSTTEIGIGSNLLLYNWITDLVKLNKSFIVRRDLQGKEMLKGSIVLSEYIRDTVTNRNQSVWIAQREGRTKDGNDKTQIGLLKMLNFSGKSDFVSNFKEINIIPVSISYEYEPCIIGKVNEMSIVRQGRKYHKTFITDLNSMGRGLYSYKGNVHFNFGTPLKQSIDHLEAITNKNEKFEEIVSIIDKEIYIGYKLTPFNYIAYDLVYKKDNSGKYNNEDKIRFSEHKKHVLASTETTNRELSSQIFYEIYATPVVNQLKIK